MRARRRRLFVLLMLAGLPAAAAEELPVPPASRRNESLSGATTLAPGKNYTRSVYETDERLETVAEFYRRELATAAMREGGGITFATARGTVRLAPLGKGTRITLLAGPQ